MKKVFQINMYYIVNLRYIVTLYVLDNGILLLKLALKVTFKR